MAIIDYLTRFQPEPAKQEVGIGGFVLFARVRDSYKLSADTPTSPVEDGSFLNDHIILKPLTLSIEGDVNDVHVRESPLAALLRSVNSQIGNLIGRYGSSHTQAQLSKVIALENDAVNAVREVDALVDAGEQIANLFGNKDTASKSTREQFIDAMEALHFGKQVIVIEMPFRRHEGMVITNFTATTDNQTNSISFTIEARKINVASLQYVQVKRPSPGLKGQTSTTVSKGAQEGKPVPRSLLSSLF